MTDAQLLTLLGTIEAVSGPTVFSAGLRRVLEENESLRRQVAFLRTPDVMPLRSGYYSVLS